MKRTLIAALSLIFVFNILMMTGCSDRKQVYLTTGFKEDELFKINDISGTLPELYIYLNDYAGKYERVYGESIFETEVDDVTMADNVKDNALAELSQIKAMNLLAKQNGTELSEEEVLLANEAATDYYASMRSDAADEYGITTDLLSNMFKEYRLSQKLYEEMIEDINPEISDDEARTITVEHIFIKTYTRDSAGNPVEYSEAAKNIAYEKAEEILSLAKDGEHDFHDLVLQFSDGELSDYSFGKGDTESEFEEAAFNLGVDEISDVVTTRYGYHIIKCLSTFNREETDLNKIKIADKLREESFGDYFDEFSSSLVTYLNDELWESVNITPGNYLSDQSFFDVYNKYFDEGER